MKQQTGFTLIEILIIMAILGVIVAVAYPNYTEQMKKSRRAEAKVALVELVQMQESAFSDNNAYASALNTGGLLCATRGTCLLDNSELYTPKKNYILTISNATARGYTITATISTTGQQQDDAQCRTFSINQKNQRTAANASGTDTTAHCW
jgi:type IV pilus assembly protein PilE